LHDRLRPYITDAILREKSLKRWPRHRKVELIETTNPEWFSFAGLAGDRSAPSKRSCVTAWILGSARVASLLAPP